MAGAAGNVELVQIFAAEDQVAGAGNSVPDLEVHAVHGRTRAGTGLVREERDGVDVPRVTDRNREVIRDPVVVDDLMANWPKTTTEIEAVGEIARANPFYRDLYLSKDGRTAGILIRPVAYPSIELEELGGFDTSSQEGNASEPIPLSDGQLAELVLAVVSHLGCLAATPQNFAGSRGLFLGAR